MNNPTSPIIGHLLEYIEQIATPEEILSFSIAPDDQARLDDLVERNSEGTLTPEERIELEQYVQMERRMILMKAKARAALQGR